MAKAPPPKPAQASPVRPTAPQTQYLAKFNDGVRNQPKPAPTPPSSSKK
jgi:hypothetical protein